MRHKSKSNKEIKLIVNKDTIKTLADNGEEILRKISRVIDVKRNSHIVTYSQLPLDKKRQINNVECDEYSWWIDFEPINGPLVGPFNTYREALDREIRILTEKGIPENYYD